MRHETEGPKPRRHVLSVRALLFGAILLAGAPGVVFGAMLAWHAYQTSARQEATVRIDDAVRISVRLEDALRTMQERAAAIAITDVIRSPGCRAFYSNIVGTQSLFSAVARVDARGRLVCATGATRPGVDFSGADWFRAIKAGAPRAETGIRATPFDVQPVLIVAHRIERGDQFLGAALLTIPRSYFSAMLAEDVGPQAGGVAVFDKTGAAISMLLRATDSTTGLAAAQAALASPTGHAATQGLAAQRVARPPGEFSVVSITPRARQAELGVRAALILLAPLLVAALMVIAMSAATHRWVLRWFARLQDTAQDYALGRYAPAPMEGAPAEIAALAQALDAAVAQSRARENEVAAALAANVSLT
ncbi:MAG: cache domain-containing protein, partial [Hyphomonadaceae bacterium]